MTTVRPPLAPAPPVYTMATTEIGVPPLETAPLMSGDQVPISATTVLTDVSVGNGTVVEGLADPVINGTLIEQLLPGSLLTATHRYELEYNFVVVDGELAWTQVLTINVPR